jgi:hypothetical protein
VVGKMAVWQEGLLCGEKNGQVAGSVAALG